MLVSEPSPEGFVERFLSGPYDRLASHFAFAASFAIRGTSTFRFS